MAFASSAAFNEEVTYILKNKAGNAVQASNVQLSTPAWVVQSTDAGPWVNVGEATDCSQEQSRQLSQVLYSQRLNQTRTGEATTENQTVTLTQSQQSIGTKETLVCEYTYTHGGSTDRYVERVPSFNTRNSFIWNSSAIGFVFDSSGNFTAIIDGYQYERGAFVRTWFGRGHYEICRRPV